MVELSISLAGRGTLPVIRFLVESRARGCLRVSDGRRSGELCLDGGRLVAARFGAALGLDALDAIVLELPPETSSFAFEAGEPAEGRPDAQLGLRIAAAELEPHLDRLAVNLELRGTTHLSTAGTPPPIGPGPPLNGPRMLVRRRPSAVVGARMGDEICVAGGTSGAGGQPACRSSQYPYKCARMVAVGGQSRRSGSIMKSQSVAGVNRPC
jgi:hypothetical protein